MDYVKEEIPINTGKDIKKQPCIMDVFTLLDNIEKCSKDSVIEAFNNSVHSLRRMLLSGTFALDSTIIETKPDFPGCGKTKRKKKEMKKTPPNTNTFMASSYSYFMKSNHE
jgi:hypothetical protein